MSRLGTSWQWVWLLTAWAAGCAPLAERGKSPLTQPKMSRDSVSLEIFVVRFPFADEQTNGSLWNEIDEQRLETSLRRRLAENGFRLGLVSQLPTQLQQLLQLSGQPTPAADESIVNLLEESPVSRRLLQNRAGQRSLIQCSGVYESLPLLRSDEGQVAGKTYPKAQAWLAVKSYPQGDGRVRLELLPELHHGDARQAWVGDQGVWRMETGQPKKVFDDLAITATLSPGETLVLTSLPARSGSLGHHFFTQHAHDSLEQKLLLVRLLQTQHNDLFGPELLEPAEK